MSVGNEEKEYASKGVAGAGLGLGIAGTALSLLNSNNGQGILGGLFGNNTVSQDTRTISALEAKIAELQSQRYTDKVGLEVYQQSVKDNKEQTAALNTGLNSLYAFAADIDKRFAVADAVNAERINCLSGRVRDLECLTKRIVPYSSICPEPMSRYNSWAAPTADTTTAG